jgi:hypothetical protein
MKTLFARFQKIKSDCRNIFGPPYTQAKKLHKSGEYNDGGILSTIWEDAVKKNVDKNFYKAKKSSSAALLKLKPNSTPIDLEHCESKFVDLKMGEYDVKKTSWITQPLPNGLLAFILCGEPGLDFQSLNVGVVKEEKEVSVKGRTGREAMRNIKRDKDVPIDKTPRKFDSVANEALSIKTKELEFKQKVFEERKKEKQLKGIAVLRDELEKNGNM